MLSADPAFLGGEVAGRKGFLWWDPPALCKPLPSISSPLKTLGIVGVGTPSKGFLLYLDNLIYCFM